MKVTMKLLWSVFLGMVIVFSVSAAMSDKAISERLSPVGKVCIEGDDCGSASAAASSGPKTPEDIYNASCMGCHSTGAMSAPKLGDAAAWPIQGLIRNFREEIEDRIKANKTGRMGAMAAE